MSILQLGKHKVFGLEIKKKETLQRFTLILAFVENHNLQCLLNMVFSTPSSFEKLIALFCEGMPSMFHYTQFKGHEAVMRDSGSSHSRSVSITLPMTCH